MDHIEETAVNIENDYHLLLAAQVCVICSADCARLQAYDLAYDNAHVITFHP